MQASWWDLPIDPKLYFSHHIHILQSISKIKFVRQFYEIVEDNCILSSSVIGHFLLSSYSPFVHTFSIYSCNSCLLINLWYLVLGIVGIHSVLEVLFCKFLSNLIDAVCNNKCQFSWINEMRNILAITILKKSRLSNGRTKFMASYIHIPVFQVWLLILL